MKFKSMQTLKEILGQLNSIEQLSSEVMQLKHELSILRSTPSIPVLISEKEISAELRICAKTLRKYRQQNIIPFVKIGRRIFYDRFEIIERLREANNTDRSIRISSKLSSVKKRLF